MRTVLLLFFGLISVTMLGQSLELDEVYSAGLPVLNIETINAERPTFKIVWNKDPQYLGNSIKDKKKVPGRITIYNEGRTVYDSGEYEEGKSGMTIKVRGNTSAIVEDKLPYNIKLQKKGDLLCRENDGVYKDRNWSLIKDKNYRNMIAFKLSELLGMQWTPAFRYVNVVMNGQYEGLYMLVESVKRNTRCRLDVSDTGYVAEFDAYFWNESIYVMSTLEKVKSYPMHYTFKYPETDEITAEQIDYFSKAVHQAEKSLTKGDYAKYIDLDSFARWMLAHDILGNNDGAGSNIFLTKYDDSDDTKFMMGCLWDMEGSFRTNKDWDSVHKLGLFFYDNLFNDAACQEFRNTYVSIWRNEGNAIFSAIMEFLNEFEYSDEAEAIRKSIALDNLRWKTENDAIETSIGKARTWFTTRQSWLGNAIGGIPTGITDIQFKSSFADKPVFYNLHGQQVEDFTKGILIRKSANSTTRIFVR